MFRILPQGRRVAARARLAERVYEGYAYIFARNENGINHVVCKSRLTELCPGRGQIENGRFILTRGYNHPTIPMHEMLDAFLAELYRATMTQLLHVPVIFQMLAERFPAAAPMVDEHKTLRTMTRWRERATPPEARTYVQYHDLANAIDWHVIRLHNHGILEITVAHNADAEPVAVVFHDHGFIQHLETCQEIHITSTARVLPRDMDNSMQLLTVVAIYQNYAFACAWAWIKSRDPEIYDTLLDPLIAVMQPQRAYGDYDERPHDQTIAVFPNIAMKGDYQSYCRALLGEADRLHLNVANDIQLQDLLKYLMGLALLPANRIPPWK